MHAAASATRAQPSLAGDPRRAGRAREGREAEGRGEGRAAREARRAQPLRKVVSLPRAAASPSEPTGAVFPTVPLHSACARPPTKSHVARASCALLYGKAALDGRVRGSRAAYDRCRCSPCSQCPTAVERAVVDVAGAGAALDLQDSLGGAHGVLGPRGRYYRSTPLSSAAVRTETDGRRGHPAGRTGRALAATHKPDSAECAAPVGGCCGRALKPENGSKGRSFLWYIVRRSVNPPLSFPPSGRRCCGGLGQAKDATSSAAAFDDSLPQSRWQMAQLQEP